MKLSRRLGARGVLGEKKTKSVRVTYGIRVRERDGKICVGKQVRKE